jgi:cell division protein ZapA
MNEEFTINVGICDRNYPIKINRNDEEKIRKAAKKINDTVAQYKQLYNSKDGQDFLAMVALQFATRVVESEEHFEIQPVIEELGKLDRQLSELLND